MTLLRKHKYAGMQLYTTNIKELLQPETIAPLPGQQGYNCHSMESSHSGQGAQLRLLVRKQLLLPDWADACVSLASTAETAPQPSPQTPGKTQSDRCKRTFVHPPHSLSTKRRRSNRLRRSLQHLLLEFGCWKEGLLPEVSMACNMQTEWPTRCTSTPAQQPPVNCTNDICNLLQSTKGVWQLLSHLQQTQSLLPGLFIAWPYPLLYRLNVLRVLCSAFSSSMILVVLP